MTHGDIAGIQGVYRVMGYDSSECPKLLEYNCSAWLFAREYLPLKGFARAMSANQRAFSSVQEQQAFNARATFVGGGHRGEVSRFPEVGPVLLSERIMQELHTATFALTKNLQTLGLAV